MPVGTVQTLGSGEERSVADDVGVGSSGQRAIQIPVVGSLRAVLVAPVVHRGFPEEHIVGVVDLSVGGTEEQSTTVDTMKKTFRVELCVSVLKG